MKQNRYSRKINQFRNLSLQVNKLIESRRWDSMTENSRHRFQWKLNQLFSVAGNMLSKKELKKILAAAAFLICIGNVNAQTFSPPVTNPFGLTNSTASFVLPCFADMDDDGDLDILTVALYTGGVKYFENTGTASTPNYAAPVINPFGIVFPAVSYQLATVDIDGDGDLDIFTDEYYGAFKYYENIGTASSPSFAAALTNPFGLDSANQIAMLAFADFDNDGDFDLLASEYLGAFKYYENTGTASSPSFAAPLTNPFGLTPAVGVTTFPAICDLDNDGDYDILMGYVYYGYLYYYRNTGSITSPAFSSPVLNPFGLSSTAGIASPTFGDIDNDGDIDLLVGDTLKFNFFENTSAGFVENSFDDAAPFSVYPNPANDEVTISLSPEENNLGLSIKDINGKLVYESIPGDDDIHLNTAGYKKGIYTIELCDRNSVFRKKLVIE